MSVIHDPAPANREPVPGTGESLRLVAEPDDMIEAAIDVLAARHQVSREEAAELLEQSGDAHERPLNEVAREVVLIGLPSLSTRTQIELRSTPPPTTGPEPGDLTATGSTTETIAAGLLERLVGIAALPDALTVISELATEVVPGCEEAGITVLREGAPAAVGAAGSRARRVDGVQFRHGQGPYLRAVRTRTLVRIDDIRAAPAGEAWARAARAEGFRAVLAVPVATGPDTAAAVSLYTARPGWSDPAVTAAQALARHAGNSIAVVLGLSGKAKISRHFRR